MSSGVLQAGDGVKNVAEAGSVASPRGLEPLSAWDPLNFLGLDRGEGAHWGTVGGGKIISDCAQGYLPPRSQGKQVNGSSSALALESQEMTTEYRKEFPMRGGFLGEVAQGVGLLEL